MIGLNNARYSNLSKHMSTNQQRASFSAFACRRQIGREMGPQVSLIISTLSSKKLFLPFFLLSNEASTTFDSSWAFLLRKWMLHHQQHSHQHHHQLQEHSR